MHRMLAAAAAVAVTLLASGCSSAPEPVTPDATGPTWVTLDPVVLAEGMFQWHETGTGVAGAFEYYSLASQAVAHPCVWDGGGGEEVYFNNLKLPTGRASQGLGAWSGNLSMTFDWTQQDWVGQALRAAYTAPGVTGWQVTAPIERGATLTVAVQVEAGNGTADARPGEETASWSIWVCLPTESGQPESPFVGSVQAKVVFQPDPVLASELAPPEDAPERTARDGAVPTQPAL